jgi:hypothetical protein
VSAAEQYLEKLRQALPRLQRRRIVAEIRNHMADDVAAEVARGVDPAEAERLTIERLGPPEELASQFSTSGRRLSTPAFAALAATSLVVVLGAVFGLSHTRHASHAPAVGRTTATAVPPHLVILPSTVRYPVTAVQRRAVIASQRVLVHLALVRQKTYRVEVVPAGVTSFRR